MAHFKRCRPRTAHPSARRHVNSWTVEGRLRYQQVFRDQEIEEKSLQASAESAIIQSSPTTEGHQNYVEP